MPEGQAKRDSGRPWRLWVWRGFRIRLPDDWEMLQFSRKRAAGSCAFADRYQYRLEFSWNMFSCKVGDARPDVKRLMSDYCAKLKLEGQVPDARPTEVGGWRGLVGHIGGPAEPKGGRTLTTRFGGYYSAESCLVELVFTWPDGRDRHLERAVLKSVKEEAVRSGGVPGGPDVERGKATPEDEGYRRWKAFGMDMLVSDGLELERCRAEPANVSMEFGRPGAAARGALTTERFQRIGMIPHWLRVPVGEWLERGMPSEMRERSRAQRVVSGHKVEAIGGLMPPTGVSRLAVLLRLTRRRNLVEAAAWVCPADGRLYCCRVDRSIDASTDLAEVRSIGQSAAGADVRANVGEIDAGGGHAALGLAGGRLSCCAALGPSPRRGSVPAGRSGCGRAGGPDRSVSFYGNT